MDDLLFENIKRVTIIDDDPDVRQSYGFSVEDLALEPILIDGPVQEPATFLAEITSSANAAICDHHLMKVKSYSSCNGAPLVSEMYKMHFPAILCTKYEDASIDEIRPLRRNIPVLLNPSDLEPESFEHGIRLCINEFKGEFVPVRRPWRALVRVEDVDDGKGIDSFFVVVPSWDSNQVIRLFHKDVPENIRSLIVPGKRLHAMVNLGAERYEEIYFEYESWEEK